MCGRALRFEGRSIEWSLHHRTARQMGGSKLWWLNLPGNLIVLCGSGTTGCHGWVESHREHAEERGFLVRRGQALPASIHVMHFVHGLIYLRNDGNTSKVPAED